MVEEDIWLVEAIGYTQLNLEERNGSAMAWTMDNDHGLLKVASD